jgi:hypothetical protein
MLPPSSGKKNKLTKAALKTEAVYLSKLQRTFTILHGFITQRMALIIDAALRNPNPNICMFIYFMLLNPGTRLQAGRSRARFRMRSLDFSMT